MGPTAQLTHLVPVQYTLRSHPVRARLACVFADLATVWRAPEAFIPLAPLIHRTDPSVRGAEPPVNPDAAPI